MPITRLLQANGRLAYFAAAMFFGALANGMAFLMLWRMRSLGRQVGIWRTLGKDWALYREYWQVAPAQNWSRAPLVVGIMSFLLAMWLMWLTVNGIRISWSGVIH